MGRFVSKDPSPTNWFAMIAPVTSIFAFMETSLNWAVLAMIVLDVSVLVFKESATHELVSITPPILRLPFNERSPSMFKSPVMDVFPLFPMTNTFIDES